MAAAQATTAQTDDRPDAPPVETNRDRVRRLFIHPAKAKGMRFPKRLPEADGEKILNRLCDDLAYLPDRALAALSEWVQCHGDGAGRSFWPPVVGIVSTAEAFQPRALEEAPGVASWFGSRAGEQALDAGRLVAEFIFWQDKKRPPLDFRDRQRIADDAKEMARKIRVFEGRVARGVEPAALEYDWVKWYRGVEARARVLVDQGRDDRAKAGAAT